MMIYQQMHLDPKCSSKDVERSYKMLAYTYASSKNFAKLEELNKAYSILKDPYSRAFYDNFGDRFITYLQNPTEAYWLTRFFTGHNILLILAFIYAHIVNYFFLGLLFVAKLPNTLRFFLFLFSPLLLVVVFVATKKHFGEGYPFFAYFVIFTVTCLLNSVSLLSITSDLHPVFLVLAEIAFNTYVWRMVVRKMKIKVRLAVLLVMKSTFLFLYLGSDGGYKCFIPTLIAILPALINPLLGFLAFLVLPMSFAIYLTLHTDHMKTYLVLHFMHIAMGLFILRRATLGLYNLLAEKPVTLLSLPPPVTSV